LDLPTLPWGLELVWGNLDKDDVAPSLEDMKQKYSIHVALSTCDPPPLWELWINWRKQLLDVSCRHGKVYY